MFIIILKENNSTQIVLRGGGGEVGLWGGIFPCAPLLLIFVNVVHRTINIQLHIVTL